MATFGKTTTGGTATSLALNNKRVCKATLPVEGLVTKLTCYMDGSGTGTGTQVAKGVIYADSSGAPGALKAVSSEVGITDGQAAGLVDFTLPSPVLLTAADYYLGLLLGANTATIRWYNDSVASSEWHNGNTYGTPSDPFGTPAAASLEFTVYATYTASAAANQPGFRHGFR